MACQGSVSLGPIHKFLLMLVLVGHPVWLFAKTLDQDPYNHLAPNMPTGAQKVLREKSEPPSAPLRLISFPGADKQRLVSGKANYGVNPLEMNLLKLKRRRPDVSVRVDAEDDVTASEASSGLSVKAIHRHIGDTVQYHGGVQDESITPGVKPPGVHVLDTVTRAMITNSEPSFKRPLPSQSSSQRLARSLDDLEALKPLLSDDGSTFVAPAQALLERVKALDLGAQGSKVLDEPAPKAPDHISDKSDSGVPDRLPDESDPKVVDRVPDESDLNVTNQTPDGPDPKVVDRVPDESNLNVTNQTPDGSDPKAVDRVPDESNLNVTNQTPDESDLNVTEQIPDESDLVVTDQLPDESNPADTSQVPNKSDLVATDQVPKISKVVINKVESVTRPDVKQPGPDESRATLCEKLAQGIAPDGAKDKQDLALSFDEDCKVSDEMAAVTAPTVTAPAVSKQTVCEQIALASSTRPKNAGKSQPIELGADCTASAQPIKDELARIEKKINAGASSGAIEADVKKDLDNVAGKIATAVGTAFDNIQKQLHAQGSDERAKADQVKVPEKKCSVIKIGGGCLIDETSKSEADRKSAQAEKDSHNKTADKFFKAADQMPVKKVAAQASIYKKFYGAERAIKESLPATISVPPTTVSASAKDSGGSDHSSHGTRPDNGHRSEVDHESAEVALVTIDSEVLEYAMTDLVNAAIGYEATAEQHIAGIESVSGKLTVNSATWLLGSGDIGSINAAIGDHSEAFQLVDSIYDESGDASIGQAVFFTQNAGEINVALGSRSKAEMLVSSLMGSVGGSIDVTSIVAAPINVAMGHNTQSVMHLGAWQGDVKTNGTLLIQPTAALAATIGEATSATVRLGSQSTGGRAHALDISVVSEGSLAAPLGYHAAAHIEMGNVDGHVGHGNVIVVTGPAVSAALGSYTVATNRVANLQEGKRVGGQYKNHAKTGGLLAFSLGDHTHATNAIGSVEANVGGDAKIHVTAGEIATGTVGERTVAETYIGSLLANVSGNADIQIVVGAVNTFAVGLSSSKEIYAKTYIGNVMSAQKNVDIDVTMDDVFNLGYGLFLDLGALGTLDITRQGCVRVGNHGRGPC